MNNQEKTGRLKEIKDSILGAVEILRQIRTSETLEFFNKINDVSLVAKEIIDGLKSPEVVKNIENFRLISENFKESSARMQNTIKCLEEAGIINESVKLVKSAKETLEFINEAREDFQEISGSFKGIFQSVRIVQNKIQTTSEKYQKTRTSQNNLVLIPEEMVITPDEVEHYLKFGWKYLAILPNGKVIVKRFPREHTLNISPEPLG